MEEREAKNSKLKIYLLQQDVEHGYDTYDSAVVIAETAHEAQRMHPSEYVTHVTNNEWMGTRTDGIEYEYCHRDWVDFGDIDMVTVTYIGEASDEQIKGILLSSFNAG